MLSLSGRCRMPVNTRNLGNTVKPRTLTLSLRERGQRLLCLQHLLDQRIGFRHVPVHEEGEH